MGRRRVTRPGATLPALGLALLAGVLTTGCGGSEGPGPAISASGSAVHPTHGSPSAPANSDAELCTRIVTHWARQVLDSSTYGDYQSMGLSNGQYAILREVVDAARAVKRHQGAAAADELIDRRTRAACADRYRHGAPSGGPWQ
ncbi:hypothetical protein ABT124_07290 [Streptomyces sp. NPDC001982]|uniref:hypothetical protein n=1 Tax=unclassified Streptomyces TaxID=2593676 RepID=UPI00332626F0